ncbi:MAG: glycosyltransferase [Acidimicrobiaceae bacterium]|nr:glycosyltransferase [Acidimicrobiaceae bacterium]
MQVVHQFLPTPLVPRDAVGTHTRRVHQVLTGAGIDGRVWAGPLTEGDSPDGDVGAWKDFAWTEAGGAGLYQTYVGGGALVDLLLERSEPLGLYYHNFTPGELLRKFDPETAGLMEQGRDELRRLAPRVRLALAPSEFNATELRSVGIRDVRIMPPYSADPLVSADPEYEDGLRATKRGLDILFVGRVAPNKGHALLTQVAAVLAAGYDRPLRCFCVGRTGPASYMFALNGLRDRLGVRDQVIFTGSVSEGRLAAHYRTADLFVCLSEHEGFCLPVQEAMRAALPVVAYSAGAVPETLGDAGVLLRTRDPLIVAGALDRLASDETLRSSLRVREVARARELDEFDRDGILLRAIHDLGVGQEALRAANPTG